VSAKGVAQESGRNSRDRAAPGVRAVFAEHQVVHARRPEVAGDDTAVMVTFRFARPSHRGAQFGQLTLDCSPSAVRADVFARYLCSTARAGRYRRVLLRGLRPRELLGACALALRSARST